jgi:hypothetical protein
VIKFLVRRALLRRTFRGGRGGRRPSLLWGVLMARWLLRVLFRDEPEVVWRGKLGDGETLVISGRDREPRVFSI